MRNLIVARSRLRTAMAALVCAAATASCGGGGYAEVVVEDDQPPIALLAISLTRVGLQAVEVAWSDDPYADSFNVRRDGSTLANVDALSLIDASVFVDARFCYQVLGYSRSGVLLSASETACISVVR